jgi:carboxylesterase type B
MFWIHGGAYSFGASNDTHYDGANIASRGDVVLVSINYRLTTFGFLALDDGVTNGNFGLADQITALHWVRANIQDFGGDPDRITVFGQSAGAGSVRAMMASEKSLGLFSGAISQSNLGGINYGSAYSKYYTIPEAMSVRVNAILNATNCTDAVSRVDCLRAIPAYTLAGLPTTISYVVVDGMYITTNSLQLDGSKFPFKLMMGTMRDDGTGFNTYPNTTDRPAYLQTVGYTDPSSYLFPTPSGANQTLDLYNVTARISTDGMFRCIDEATVYAATQNNRSSSIYYYEFDRSYNFRSTGIPNGNLCEPPATSARPHGDPSMPYFQCHSGELNYVFGNLAHLGLPMRDEYDLPFEQFVLDTWTSFARTYNPNVDRGYLESRRYQTTIDELDSAGLWIPSSRGNMTMRVMDWPSYQSSFREAQQCDNLSLPLSYYIKAV